MEGSATAGHWGWLRATGLMLGTGLSSVVSSIVLIAVPFGLLVFFLPPRRLVALILAAVGIGLVAIWNPASGLWYVERGWALLLGGCFLALSIRWPEEGFLPRGLGAVLGAFLGTGLLFWVRPGDWAVLDWAVGARIESAVGYLVEGLRVSMGPERLPENLDAWLVDVAAMQSLVYPALVGLASLSALGLAWWLYRRLSGSPEEGIGPLREFRFNDQLVWVLIFGVVALLASSGAIERLGTNAVVFMGGLYALRGAAVALFLIRGVSFFGGALLFFGFVFLAPYSVMGAVFFGLGDTWFDLRARRASTQPGA